MARRPSKRDRGTPDPAPEVPLPRTVELLWRGRQAPRRGPRPALSLERITAAAMEIADEEGLAAVSMARIAEQLGFTTMSLYRYVSSKDEVLALMSDAGAGAPVGSFRRPGDASWRDGMERWCLAQYDLLMHRRWFADLALYTLPVGPNRLAWIDRGLELLDDTPLDTPTRFEVIGLLAQHVLGEARLQIEMERLARANARAAGAAPDEIEMATDPFAPFEAILQHVADPATYPSIYQAVREGATAAVIRTHPSDDARRGEALFRIRTVLDGVDVLIARQRRARRRRPADRERAPPTA